jgi:hypothetical protein
VEPTLVSDARLTLLSTAMRPLQESSPPTKSGLTLNDPGKKLSINRKMLNQAFPASRYPHMAPNTSSGETTRCAKIFRRITKVADPINRSDAL